MKTTVSELDFNQAMRTYECGFSDEGSLALFEYLEELERDCDIEIELDPIAIRCEYTEYEDLQEIRDQYYDLHIEDIDELREHTQVIEFEGGLIIQDF